MLNRRCNIIQKMTSTNEKEDNEWASILKVAEKILKMIQGELWQKINFMPNKNMSFDLPRQAYMWSW